MGEGRRLQQVTRHSYSQLQPRVPKPAATLWPGASNPAPLPPDCPSAPALPHFFIFSSINSNSKKVVPVLTVDTKRESWVSRPKPSLFVPTNSSCVTPLSYKEKGRSVMASECRRKNHVHSKDCRWDRGTESSTSTLSPYLYVGEKRSKGGKRVHVTLL